MKDAVPIDQQARLTYPLFYYRHEKKVRKLQADFWVIVIGITGYHD